ncbi:uncharacterized protein LOC133323322 [Musca vetustissima]|uniref:uncharacterized protein LOC133323322 n=1 Tax=Musca vetustissima TaxID=27455 RepID=UPI002AB6971C|nr:uncharacterized protein LOC133323322 [Musca vetustissima]
MRAFIALSALLAVCCAAPQYGYVHPETNIGLPLVSGGHRGGDKYLPPAVKPVEPIVRKQFYVISAPEDNDNKGRTKHLVLGRPQTNYRVVFIKAPSSGAGNVKYSAEFAPQQEKTVIYVLNKKENELEAGDIATPAPTAPSKPEVFFIKYKNDDEAKQAQKEIQEQYNKLGGTNEIAEETTAPITSVIGTLESLNPDGSYNYRKTNENVGTIETPNTQYLPSALKA